MTDDQKDKTKTGWTAQAKARLRRAQAWTKANVPFGVRSVLGVLLVFGGLLGFLPVLGFWMIPLGIAVIAIDVAQLWRALSGRR